MNREITNPNIIMLVLSLNANTIGSYSISPRSVLKQTLVIQNKYRLHNIQRNYMVAKALQMSAKMGADEAVSTGH